jgi:hypothetical protein
MKTNDAIVFYGEHKTHPDEKGRLHIPVGMVARRDTEEYGFLDNESAYVITEPYGIYLALFSEDVEKHYLDLDPEDKERRNYFRGHQESLDTPGDGDKGTRISLDKKLGKIDMSLIGNGDHLRIELEPEDWENLDWENFVFSRVHRCLKC